MKRLILGLPFLLVGCNSFNSTVIMENDWQSVTKVTASAGTVDYPPPPIIHKPVVITKVVKKVVRVKGDVCPRMELPPIEKLPPLPLEELHRINPADHERADQLVMQHIRDLRAYADRMVKREAEYRQRYRSACQSYQRSVE